MGKRWRDNRSAYSFDRTAYDGPQANVVTDSVGNEVWAIGPGEQFIMPGQDDPRDEYIAYEVYNSDAQDAHDYMGGEIDSGYTPDYPGAREYFHAEWQNAGEYDPTQYPQASIKDAIDYQVGGQFSLVNNVPYSMGVVSPEQVENFALEGQQVVLRRETDLRAMNGPVATADANAQLALAYLQLANQQYPNEFSQSDLVVSV